VEEKQDNSSLLEELVEKSGYKVGIHSGYCVEWNLTHKNCTGCEYYLGCGKLVRLKAICLGSLLYEPRSYDDFVKMANRQQELMELTLKAKTAEELGKVPTL